MPVLAVTFISASFLFIRGLVRWGKGIKPDDGEREFPSLSRSLMPAAILYAVGPIILLIPVVVGSIANA